MGSFKVVVVLKLVACKWRYVMLCAFIMAWVLVSDVLNLFKVVVSSFVFGFGFWTSLFTISFDFFRSFTFFKCWSITPSPLVGFVMALLYGLCACGWFKHFVIFLLHGCIQTNQLHCGVCSECWFLFLVSISVWGFTLLVFLWMHTTHF